MLETSDEDDPNWRNKYRNPSPPPGYIRPNRKKKKISDIYRMIEDLLNLSIYLEIFDNPNIEDFVPESSEDGELSEKDFKKKIKCIKQNEENDKSYDDHSSMLVKQEKMTCELSNYFSTKKPKYKKKKYRLGSKYLSSEEEYSDSSRRKHSRSLKRKYSGPMHSSSEDDRKLMLDKQKEMICKDKSQKSNFSLKYKKEKYPESKYLPSEKKYSNSSGKKWISKNSRSTSSSSEDYHSKSRSHHLGSSSKRHSYSKSPDTSESYESDYDSKRSRKRRNSRSTSSSSVNYRLKHLGSSSRSPTRYDKIESYESDYDSKRSRSRKRRKSRSISSSSENYHSKHLGSSSKRRSVSRSPTRYKIESYESDYDSKRSRSRKRRNSRSSSSENYHSKHLGSSSKRRSVSRSPTRYDKIESYESDYDLKRSRSRKRRNSHSISSSSENCHSKHLGSSSKRRSYSRSPSRYVKIESYEYDYDSKRSTSSKTDNDYYYDNYIDEEEDEFNINDEDEDEFCVVMGGSYYCKLCKATMNSKQMLYMHKNGKKHLKALKNVNATKTLENSISKIKINKSRYPVVPAGRIRIRVDEVAFAQNLITEKITVPFPGLDHVIEIQGIESTHYYCELCDSPCTTETIFSHLQGYKHQINCLKHFDPETYAKYARAKKRDIEKSVINILRNVQKKEGEKRMVVEKEFPYEPKSNSCHIQHDKQGGSNGEGTVTSSIYIPGDFSAKFEKAKEPDTSMSDFYCRLCDAHMNSKDMWDKHTSGNRHIKNLKKAPGEIPSKVKSLKIPDANSKLMNELKTVDGPIIGLKVIRETQNPLIKSVRYNCCVCRSCMTEIDIIEHITSRKHKTAYLQNIENRSYDLLKKTGINEKHLEETINDICYEVIEKEGSGRPEVYVLKNAISTYEKY